MPLAEVAKKERGCFQCSRRRIVCDRTEPSCAKCAKKGIECSGLGRIRFVVGVARRGRLKDCKIPKAGGADGFEGLPTTNEFQPLCWPSEQIFKTRRKGDAQESSIAPESGALSLDLPTEPQHVPDTEISTTRLTKMDADSEDVEIEDFGRGHNSVMTTYSNRYNLTPWIAPIDPSLRMLFAYCTSLVVPPR